MNTKALYDSLSTKLNLLKLKTQTENKVNDYSANILLESVGAKILNVIFDTELTNANLIERNYPGVDLVDINSKLMIQVSTTSTANKIQQTLKQIQKHNLIVNYKELKFLFLGESKSLSAKSKGNIDKMRPSGLKFNVDKDLYSLDTLYERLFLIQDTDKTLEVLQILNEVLGFIPDSKRTGFECISISSSSKNKGTDLIVDHLLKEGINVYIDNMDIYERLVHIGHGHIDYLIPVNDSTPINHIKYAIVIIDDEFVIQNKGFSNVNSRLLSDIMDRDGKIQVVDYLDVTTDDLVKNPHFKNWISCSKKNLQKKMSKVLSDFFKGELSAIVESLEISEELKKINANFIFEDLTNDSSKGYQLFKFTFEQFHDVTIYYVVLKKNYTLSLVKDHLNKHFKIIKNRTTVLVPRDYLQKTNRKIRNIKKALNVESVQYISEHLFEKTLKSERQVSILHIDDFVEPILQYQGRNIQGSKSIISWVKGSNDTSVAIVSGQGGIGKTTLCHKIHDLLIESNNGYHVIFINSEQLIKEFLDIDFNNEQEYDIYNLYRISHKSNGDVERNIIDQKSFEINYKLGNILIVFDGIDELISTVPSFTLDGFLRNVSKIEAGIGRGKIIINCRDTYINDYLNSTNTEDHLGIDVFELLPFNKELAKLYFKQHFIKDKKIEKCLHLLEEFTEEGLKGDSFVYPPFVVEIVRLFVEKDIEIEDGNGDVTFISSYLSERNANDLIVFKTCNREILKKETYGFELTVDRQIEFMMEIAYSLNGKLSGNDFERILKRINCTDRVEGLALGLKDHPFLSTKDEIYGFRFDFLNTFFKSVLINSVLQKPKHRIIDGNLVNLIAEEMDYYSQTTKYLIPKLEIDTEKYVKNCRELIDLIKSSDMNSLQQKRKAISNVLMLLLQVVKIEPSSLTKNLLLELFESNESNNIDGLCLIDIPKSINLKLYFKGLYFTNCIIENYPNFLLNECDNDTFFDDSCELNKIVSISKTNQSTLEINHFHSKIKGDNTLMKSLSQEDGNSETALVISATNSLKTFFKCFYDGNSLIFKKSISQIKTNYKYAGGKANFDVIMQLLEDNEVVTRNDDICLLNKKSRANISKFVGQGLNFNEFNVVIEKIKSNLEHFVSEG